MFIPIEVALMILSGGALFFLAPALVSIFSNSQEVSLLGITVLRMVALSEPFYGFSIIMEGMMLGTGNTRKPFAYNILGMWGIRIIGTMICIRFFALGLVAAWACMIAHNLLLFALYLVNYWTGKWNPLERK